MSNVNIFVIVLHVCFVFVASQSALRYDVFEEENIPMTITDLLRDAGLRERYSPEVVSTLTLDISPHEQSHDESFSVTSTGMLTVSSRLDRDVICPNIQFCVINLDIKIQPVEYFDIIKIELNILDKNDNDPSFGASNTYSLRLFEGPLPDIPHGLPLATDPDSPAYSVGSYDLSGHSDEFSLQTYIGNDGTIEPQLKLLTSLDREDTSRYLLILRAMDKGSPQRTGSVTIIVDVTDTNDQYPVFDSQVYEKTIDEDLTPGSFVIAVRATDMDEGENAEVEYSFAPQVEQSVKDAFDIDATLGDITVNGVLDYEVQQDYTLIVIGRDKGQSPLSSQTRVLIHLRDINDNPPNIEIDSSGPVTIEENSPLESFVAYIRVSDRDSDQNGEFECQLDGTRFILDKLHQTDYKLLSNTELDREVTSEYFVSVVCRDNGQPVMSSTLDIEITVTDANDNPPIFQESAYFESILETNEIGQTLMSVKATDKDIGNNGAIIYSFAESPSFSANSFSIDPVIGDITIVGPVDHEESPEINLIVVATDQGQFPNSANVTITITVIDTDDERPIFILQDSNAIGYEFDLIEHENANAYVGKVEARDRDSEKYNKITYSIFIQQDNNRTDSVPFRIDSERGDVYSTMELDREQRASYTFTVMASGNPPHNWQSEKQVTVSITDKNDHAPHFVFPNVVNNSAHLSSSVKEGVFVSKLEALDEDVNENALLRYSISYDSSEVKFEIDEYSGRITASSDFTTKKEVVVLTVTVQDSGKTPMEDTSYLNVVFSAPSASKSRSDFNESLVIGIAVLAAVVVTILILAIVCLLRRHNRGKEKHSNYLKNCNVLMNANNIVGDDSQEMSTSGNNIIVHKNNLGNNSLDSSFHSSIMEKNSVHSLGQDNRGMIYDSERGSFVVQPWKQASNNYNLNMQAGHQKAIPEEDSDSACSLEGDNSDSGRGSNDDFSLPNALQRNPPIPQRHPVIPPSPRDSSEWVPTRHLDPGVHKNTNLQQQRSPMLRHQLYPDNKQYYDERVFPNGAPNRSNEHRSQDNLPSYHKARPLQLSERTQRNHGPSPSPSLQYQPGHEQNLMQNIQRQQSLNLPDVPPRKSVHYCSQV